jgi:hypothetical protein
LSIFTPVYIDVFGTGEQKGAQVVVF